MTLPGFLLGLLTALALAALAHLITGGPLLRLLTYLIIGQLAFWLGHLVAAWGWLSFGRVGVIWLGTAMLSESLTLVVTALLSGPPRTDLSRER